MSDELRVAAERLRRCRAGERQRTVYGFDDEKMDDFNYRMLENQYTADLKQLALAYLAEHPADDDHPATEEWAKSLGLHAYKRLSGAIEYSIGEVFLEFGGGSVWLGVEAAGDRIFLTENPTRRHLRMLLWVAGQQLPTKGESP